MKMRRMVFAAALVLATAATGSVAAPAAANKDQPDASKLDTVRSRFGKLMELANKHDLKALHEMFWQSSSALECGAV